MERDRNSSLFTNSLVVTTSSTTSTTSPPYTNNNNSNEASEPLLGCNSGPPASLPAGSFSPTGNPGARNSLPRGSRGLEAARYLRRASSRRFMREQSVLVRESAAEQLEERQSDWAYSRPVVVLDLIWNLAFVSVAMVVLLLSKNEKPLAHLRVWVVGYSIQCIVHMICVWSEYKRRRERNSIGGGVGEESHSGLSPPSEVESLSSRENSREGGGGGVMDNDEESGEEEVVRPEGASVAKRLESLNTMFSFIWWIFGFWFILSNIDNGFQAAPLLSWLCTVFLAFDVFFVVFCVALFCVIGIAVCCCLPCIIAILYAVADQEGASEDDIKALPKYKFRQVTGDSWEAGVDEDGKLIRRGGVMSLVGGAKDQQADRNLSAEDAECCICLSPYDDGTELRVLPCLHHFHCTCIDKWLRTKPTCPLCKYDIVNGRETPENFTTVESSTVETGDGNV